MISLELFLVKKFTSSSLKKLGKNFFKKRLNLSLLKTILPVILFKTLENIKNTELQDPLFKTIQKYSYENAIKFNLKTIKISKKNKIKNYEKYFQKILKKFFFSKKFIYDEKVLNCLNSKILAKIFFPFITLSYYFIFTPLLEFDIISNLLKFHLRKLCLLFSNDTRFAFFFKGMFRKILIFFSFYDKKYIRMFFCILLEAQKKNIFESWYFFFSKKKISNRFYQIYKLSFEKNFQRKLFFKCKGNELNNNKKGEIKNAKKKSEKKSISVYFKKIKTILRLEIKLKILFLKKEYFEIKNKIY